MDAVDRALREYGLLLQQDKTLPSVAGIIAGEPLSTSWWSHPKGRAIFARMRKLEDEVLITRLVGGKVTYVHERLWPAFLAIAMSNASWQRDGLPADATNRELQQRLLVAAREVHTESGKHEIEVESWESWTKSSARLQR